MTDLELHEKFKDISDRYSAYQAINNICRNNDMEALRYLTKSEEYKNFVHPFLGDAYINACILNKIEIVKYLLTEPGLTVNVPIRFHNYDALIHASRNGNIDIIKYLLTSPDLKEHADVNAQDDMPLYAAFNGNHPEVIDYLLHSSDLKKHADINGALIHATQKDNLKVIERIYLSSSELFTDKIEELFILAYQNKSMDTLHYLIFEKNIEKTEKIKEFLNDNSIEQVKNWFELREVNKGLNHELPSNKTSEKRNKL